MARILLKKDFVTGAFFGAIEPRSFSRKKFRLRSFPRILFKPAALT